jgi:hypothetical protein
MQILLLHPEDSPLRGPWSRRRWDLIIDLGKSSHYSEQLWSEQYGCPVLRSDCFRHGVPDARRVRQIFSAGRGQLIDEEGIDWWDLISLLFVSEALNLLAFERIATQIAGSAELWSTRPGWPASVMAALLGRSLRTFGGDRAASFAARAGHYAGLARRFSAGQIKEIVLDKYDSGYRWRSRFTPRPGSCADSVILLPSAYENVSRMAADYARLLPRQSFLMVATRRSGRQFSPPANVQLRDLASYAHRPYPAAEISSLEERWMKLRADLFSSPEMRVLLRTGVLDPFGTWLRDGVCVRDAWREVFEREPVCGVLCGDDSNRFTRLPVLLAARRKIPTADFHHGAFDGFYLLKDLPCDVYLAKNEMERDYLLRVCGLASERVVIAAPARTHISAIRHNQSSRRSLVLFSEPYEVVGIRGEEVYRELLPRLLRLARENDRALVIKLHPFESRAQRTRLVREVLGRKDAAFVSVLDGPLTADLLAQTWCGITIESTTVMDCRQSGVCCFLCGWLTLSPYEYKQQFARFGMGEVLHSVEQIEEIPARLAGFHIRIRTLPTPQTAADPQLLQRLLTSGLREFSGARSVS